MKGYMMDETAKSQIERFRKRMKGVSSAERMEKLLMNLQLDGHLVEIPIEDEMTMNWFISDYRSQGWSMVTIPDTEIEGKLLARALEASGKRLKWDGE
jgi:hypothetical protein